MSNALFFNHHLNKKGNLVSEFLKITNVNNEFIHQNESRGKIVYIAFREIWRGVRAKTKDHFVDFIFLCATRSIICSLSVLLCRYIHFVTTGDVINHGFMVPSFRKSYQEVHISSKWVHGS